MIWLSIQHFTVLKTQTIHKTLLQSSEPSATSTIPFKRPITFSLRIRSTSAAGRFCDLEAEIPLHLFSLIISTVIVSCSVLCRCLLSMVNNKHPLHNTMMACCPITFNRQKRSYPRIFSTTQRGIWTHPSKLYIEDVKYLLLITWPEI